MDTWHYLPRPYADLIGYEEFRFSLRIDLGPDASADRIASCLDAVRNLLDLGERWAIVLAHDAASQALLAELMAEEEASIAPLTDVLNENEEKLVLLAVEAIRQFREIEHGEALFDAPSLLAKYADTAVPELLGPPLRVEQIYYRNPIELVIIGGTLAAVGAVQVLTTVRDWRARKRAANATAAGTEAQAIGIAAQARAEIARADVMQYLAGEVTSGRLRVPPSELVKLLTPTDLKSMTALGPETSLQLPGGLSDLFRAHEPDKGAGH